VNILVAIAKTPKVIRFFIWPLMWRSTIISFALCFCQKYIDYFPYRQSKCGCDLSGMFYAMSAVYGVLAGFVITSLTIISASDSESAKEMRASARNSIPIKLLWAVFTLLVFSVILALVGPVAHYECSLCFLMATIVISIIEFVVIIVLIFFTITS
jgi:hypothetical protein